MSNPNVPETRNINPPFRGLCSINKLAITANALHRITNIPINSASSLSPATTLKRSVFMIKIPDNIPKTPPNNPSINSTLCFITASCVCKIS